MVGVLEDGQPVTIILQVQLVVFHVRTYLQHLQELPPKNRILSSNWLAHFYLKKKSAKGLHYFGLDCGVLDYSIHEP
jgi:hypothetical protein